MLERPPTEFTKRIIQYQCNINNVTIDELEAAYKPEGIIDHCLAATEHLVEDWYDAILMLKDLVTSYQLKDHKTDYTSLVANSNLLERSRDWLFKAPAIRRDAVIYVMGKLNDKQYLPILNEVFEQCKDTEPFVMGTLMPELKWLGDGQYDHKFNYLSNHKNLVFRLTCVASIQEDAKQGIKESIELLEEYQNHSQTAIAAVANTDFYSFNLAVSACREELSEQTISLQQFSNWIMRAHP